MNLANKTFTGFSNVILKGTSTDNASAKEAELRFEMGGAKTDTTLTIAQRGGSQEFPYLRVAGAGLSIGTGFIEVVRGSFSSTMSVGSTQDANYAVVMPSMSGTVPVCGTFTVQMPAIAAGAFSGTNVVLTGARADAALVCTIQNTFKTVTTDRGSAALIGAVPAAGYAHLTFFNFGTTATIPNTVVCSYAMTR